MLWATKWLLRRFIRKAAEWCRISDDGGDDVIVDNDGDGDDDDDGDDDEELQYW